MAKYRLVREDKIGGDTFWFVEKRYLFFWGYVSGTYRARRDEAMQLLNRLRNGVEEKVQTVEDA